MAAGLLGIGMGRDGRDPRLPGILPPAQTAGIPPPAAPPLAGITHPPAIPGYAPTAAPAGPAPLPPIGTTNGVPNPDEATAAQIAAGQGTSQYNNALTHGGTYTPLGSQTYTSHIDPATGAVVYDTHVNLSPDQQKLLDIQNKNALGAGGIATGLLGKIGSEYGSATPTNPYSWSDFNTERSRVEDSLYKQNTQYLDPQFAQKKEALGQQLASQGIVSGSEAWTQAMNQLASESQKAYGDARLSAISGSGNEATLFGNAGEQQLRDALISRNEPLNEYKALNDASPVNIPQFNPAQTPLAPNVDPAGNAYKSADEQIQQQAIRSGNRNAVTAGLFGLGADVLGSKWGGDLITGGLSKLGGMFGLGGSAAAPAGAGVAAGAGAGAAGGGAGALGEISVGPATWGAGVDAGGVLGSGAGAVAPAALGEGGAAGAGGMSAGAAAGVGAGALAAAYGAYKIGDHYNWWGNNNPSRIGESHVPPGALQWAAPNGDNIIAAPSASGATLAMQVNHGSAPGDPVLYSKTGNPKTGAGGWELKGFRQGEDTTLTNQATGQSMKITDPAFQSTFGLTPQQFMQMYQLVTSSYTQ